MQLICLHQVELMWTSLMFAPSGADVNAVNLFAPGGVAVDMFAPGGADVNAVDLFAPGEFMWMQLIFVCT